MGPPTLLVCTAPLSTPLARGRPSPRLMLMLLFTIVSTAPQLIPSLDTLDTLDTLDWPTPPTPPTPLVCTAPSSTLLARGRPSLQLMLMLLSTIVSTAPQLIPSPDTLDTPYTPDTLDTLHLEYTVTSSTTSTTIIKQYNVNNCNSHAFKKNVMSSIKSINFTFQKLFSHY